MVISMVAWPSSSWTAFSGTPRIVRCEAKVCRRSCQPSAVIPARTRARRSGPLASFLVIARRIPRFQAGIDIIRPRTGMLPRQAQRWAAGAADRVVFGNFALFEYVKTLDDVSSLWWI